MTGNEILFLQVELKAQPVGYSLNAPLKADRVAGRRDNDRLPTISVISANADMYIAYAKRSDDHLRQLFSGFKFLGHRYLKPPHNASQATTRG